MLRQQVQEANEKGTAMSEALYERVLSFFPYRLGVAKACGRVVRIHSVPDLCGCRVVAIEYMPEVHVARVQPFADGWRDMSPEECAAAEGLMEWLCRPDPQSGFREPIDDESSPP
jgi:hypothetical protein